MRSNRLLPILFGTLATICLALPAGAQTAADSAAVRSAALDYIEGWYAGDAERMARALHPALAKRIVSRDPNGDPGPLREMTAEQLIQATRTGGGSRTPAERQRADVRILDMFEGAASVRIDAGDWVDYMHLARTGDGWQIVNVLWEYRPERRPRAAQRR